MSIENGQTLGDECAGKNQGELHGRKRDIYREENDAFHFSSLSRFPSKNFLDQETFLIDNQDVNGWFSILVSVVHS